MLVLMINELFLSDDLIVFSVFVHVIYGMNYKTSNDFNASIYIN